MQFSDTNKSALIYDSDTTLGYTITEDLLRKGCKVYLFLLSDRQENDRFSLLLNADYTLEIFYLSENCIDNYLDKIFSISPQKIFIIPQRFELAYVLSDRSETISQQQVDFNYFSLLLTRYAENQGVPIFTSKGYLVDSDNLSKLVDRIVEFLYSPDRQLWFNTLDVLLCISPQFLFKQPFEDDLNLDFRIFPHIQLRDLLKCIFEALGAELEFSGKGIQEKGVIVDYEEELLVPSAHIRLGNTIIKINDKTYEKLAAIPAPAIVPSNTADLPQDISVIVRKLILKKTMSL